MALLAIGLVGFMVFALSFGGLVFWLLLRRDGPKTGVAKADSRMQDQAALPSAAPVIEMFNGRDLEGWDFDPSIWSVRNGVISGDQRRSGYGSSLFWRDTVSDFELRFYFRLLRGNSGIYYRAKRLANFDVGGYEFEIFTNKTGNLADNGTDRTKRRLYRADDAEAPIDSEWHEGVIIATGARLVHILDGKTLCDVEDADPAAPRTGTIAFANSASGTVEFKDLRLKRLKTNP